MLLISDTIAEAGRSETIDCTADIIEVTAGSTGALMMELASDATSETTD